MLRMPASVAVALALAGCLPPGVSTVETNVEVFHNMSADYVGRQVAIVAADPNKANSIEFTTYASKLAERLTNAGFQVVPPDPDKPPDYVAAFAYGGGAATAAGSHPIEQALGVVGAGAVGFLQALPLIGNGVDGAREYLAEKEEDRVAQSYIHAIVVNVVRVPKGEHEEPQQVYMVTAQSVGGCRTLSSVMDPILDAAFADFPGESGNARTTKTNPKSGFCSGSTTGSPATMVRPSSTVTRGGARTSAGSASPASGPKAETEPHGERVYDPSECIGPVIMGRCHGTILPNRAYHPTCYGGWLNGECTGPMF